VSDIVDAIRAVPDLLFGSDGAVRHITARTLLVSGSATLLATACGIPLGYALARWRFRGRSLLMTSINTAMGMPPVLVGLIVWLLLVRSGPLGDFALIYTKTAMIIAQFLIALPLVISFTATSIQALPPLLPDLLTALGANPLQRMWLLSREAKLGILVAILAGFGGVISEVGASMTVGGNLQSSTRVLTTAIVTETGRGELGRALALGIILLCLAFTLNLALTLAQQRRRA
jgi:tungstate transport system permease protein